MRIQLDSLTVRAFRGIPDQRTFQFDGRNVVITGPNGAGKSAVLQAIEFLLTGEISALRGSGTGGIHVKEHVPNRTANPADTEVTGTFIDDNGDSFQVSRGFTNSGGLVAERRPPEFRALLDLAERGLLLLSREELLELVIATPGNRKDQIYHLLDTSGVDDRRRQLKRLARKADTEVDLRRDRQQEAITRLTDVVSPSTSIVRSSSDDDESVATDALVSAVNRRRQRLDGDDISTVDDVGDFRDGLQSPVEQASHPLQRSDVRSHLTQVQDWLADVGRYEESLRSLASDIRALQTDAAALSSLSELALIKQGRTLIDDTTTECPLCQTAWESGELASHVEQREDRLSRIEDKSEAIKAAASDLSRELDDGARPLVRLIEVLDDADLEVAVEPLQRCLAQVQGLRNLLAEPLVDEIDTIDPADFEVSLGEGDAIATIAELEQRADSLPAQSTLTETWDELGTLHDAYEDWLDATEQRAAYERANSELGTARDEFVEARNDVLEDLYAALSERFAEIYRVINPDEGTFDPLLKQTDTGVKFSVDFHGDDEHPPNALHSEGHQDLMGICLFLALAEEFSPLERTPILLDDVVMSVDATHRKRVAEVLARNFSDQFQFFLTTHDANWASQLQEAGLASSSNLITFENWTLEDGPV